MQGVLLVLAFIAFAVLITVINRTGAKRFDTRWQEAADILDLEYERRGPELGRIHGELAGHRVEIDVEFRSSRWASGKDRYSRYRVFYDDLGLGLKLRRQKAWTKAIAAVAGDDLEVDDTEFDKAFLIGASDDAAIRAFLTPVRKDALLDLVGNYPDFVMQDDALSWITRGTKAEGSEMATHVQRLVAAVRRLNL